MLAQPISISRWMNRKANYNWAPHQPISFSAFFRDLPSNKFAEHSVEEDQSRTGNPKIMPERKW